MHSASYCHNLHHLVIFIGQSLNLYDKWALINSYDWVKYTFILQERQTMQEGSSAPCSFRISSEGLPLILPYITKQILHASPADFKHLLQNKEVKFEDFTDVAGIGGLIKTLHLDWSPLCCWYCWTSIIYIEIVLLISFLS